MESKLLDFVTGVLNEGNKHDNAIAYDEAYFDGGKEVKIVFNRDHRKLYSKLLVFCAQENITVISTHPCTLETIVRVGK